MVATHRPENSRTPLGCELHRRAVGSGPRPGRRSLLEG
jgi:hypothetical protein